VTALPESSGSALLASRVRVPGHVVYRAFANETVILNLETGRYHSVNQTGAVMLETLDKADSVSDAAERLAERYRRPLDEIQTDLCEFCEGLLERNLLELDSTA